jgi:hypothetical protein
VAEAVEREMVPRSTAERLLDIRDAATGLRDIVADMDTAFNATDPLSPILIVGLLAPIIGQSAASLGGAAALLFGMFVAATTWWVCLSGGIALLRSRLSPGILVIVNQVAGAILTVYGVAALARSAGIRFGSPNPGARDQNMCKSRCMLRSPVDGH